MDLTVETKQYRLSYEHLEMSYIHNFISDMIKGNAKQGETYYLTRKKVKELIEYLKVQSYQFDRQKERLIEELSNLEMLMVGKEKASFYFW